MFQKIKIFLEKHGWIIPLGLFALFMALTLPGISWGAPSVWHPDEVVVRSIKALHGEWKFSEINFDYPDLPQYAMFFLGKILLSFGKADGDILVASRVLSAALAGFTIVLTYNIARRIGGSIFVAGLSGLLLISVSEMAHNGRFAHNDTYLIFFTTLSVLCLVTYINNHNKVWLYASFITVGMAASSKYIGGSLALTPLVVYLTEQRQNLRKNWFSIAETLFISAVITFLGFGIGTPKALFWMTYYFKRVMPTLQFQMNYGHQADSIRGIIGQYAVMANGLGLALVLLFGIAFVWTAWKVVKAYRAKSISQEQQTKSFAVIVLAILVLDLPMMISYNYQLRYFLTLMPFLAVLTAFFVDQIYQQAINTKKRMYPFMVGITVSAIIVYSIARIVSLMLLVMNDARIPASDYLRILPLETSLEHTYYPPSIPPEHFAREHNYPIYFRKVQDEPLPVSKKYEFNIGEVGLNKRDTNYLIVDSFTSDKFNNPYTCADMQVECDFFKQLETGQSEHYKLLKEFKYTLPPYLPQIRFEFINPTIRIYERIP